MNYYLIALLIGTALSAIPTKVTNCMADPKIVFTSATFSVAPAKGVDETITLYGSANQHVELTNVLLKAKWNGVEAFEDNYPEDEVYDKGDPVNYSLTQNFPTYTPSVKNFIRLYRVKYHANSGFKMPKEPILLVQKFHLLFDNIYVYNTYKFDFILSSYFYFKLYNWFEKNI